MASSVWWIRRDLRLSDQPALVSAAAAGEVLPLFVIDPSLWRPSGDVRRAYLLRSLREFDSVLAGALHVRIGDPTIVVPNVASLCGASEVHVAADFGPYGRKRDGAVDAELRIAGRSLVRTGSPYAVAPGRVRKDDGTPYRVFTPFYRAWLAHGWRSPAPPVRPNQWARLDGSQPLPPEPDLGPLELPPVGEVAAQTRWSEFRASDLADYADLRDRPDLSATSGLSAALKWGEIHPRTLLADLDDSRGHEVFRRELAWREFYADVLHQAPETARRNLRTELDSIEYDQGASADQRFEAWRFGRTGYPFVDAGMRQLLAEGWMHNRVRMVAASFLVKDLHLPWTRGARWFMQMLRDADVASNQHGWQWVAGTGTDAAPYFRVFNPVAQGKRFDAHGDYVRRYVPELRDVDGVHIHEPWLGASGLPSEYTQRIVDHEVERQDALDRYASARRR